MAGGRRKGAARREPAFDVDPEAKVRLDPPDRVVAPRARARSASRTRRGGRGGGAGGSVLRRMFYWSLVLGLWATIAVAGTLGFVTLTLPPIQSPDNLPPETPDKIQSYPGDCDYFERIHITAPSREQACIILEYLALHGERWGSNYPTLSYRVAQTLSRYLPTGRPDLECRVKDTTYKTDAPTKEILLGALRGEQRGSFDRLVRRLLWKLFSPQDRPEILGNLWRFFARGYEFEMWDEWIADKRCTLLAQIEGRQSIGRASPESAAVPGWGAARGQLYDIDVVGYAKRIARAQSGGADVSEALQDLRRLTVMARKNLAVLEGSVEEIAASPPLWSEGDATPLPENSNKMRKPSPFGLQQAPTNAQLIDFERRTLAVLDGLAA
jgi:hypothetical protein